MEPITIHQAIHGYRDGHRLLSSSVPLGADASRAMLVLSDMSGPSMHPGFEEYLTGFPLPNTDLFVFAKTWYAPEMQRPGCVWTHSLLLSRENISQTTGPRLLELLHRPEIDRVENSASLPIHLDNVSVDSPKINISTNNQTMTALIGAVLGQPRPVLVSVDGASQLEFAILRLWDELWPSEKARFSFCTGALLPRTVSGMLMDVQAIPRALSPSQFRKSAGSAFVLDLRAPMASDAWIEMLLEIINCGDGAFRAWAQALAGAETLRGAFPSLIPIFRQWQNTNRSAREVLTSVIGASNVEDSTRIRLIKMLFDRVENKTEPSYRRELLQELCSHQGADLSWVTSLLEDQTRRLFDESRTEGCAFVLSLLNADLSGHGERLLRTTVQMLLSEDVETFGNVHAQYLPTIIGANPILAKSPTLWARVGSRATDVLSLLDAANLNRKDRDCVIEAVLDSGHDVPADALIRFGGEITIDRYLAALTKDKLQVSWQWRTALSTSPTLILNWFEGNSSLTLRNLEICSLFLSPKANLSRLTNLWLNGISTRNASPSTRVAAFGLALALANGDSQSALLEVCFQPTYDSASNSLIENEEWDWLRDLAPTVSWWRDWDKCERLAAALAHLLEKQKAPLETVFRILHSRQAIRKVAAILDDAKPTRTYLNSLRKKAETSSSTGTHKQREALLEDR